MKRLALCAAVLLGFASSAPVGAHPHILIDAQVNIVFDDDGALVRFEHAWTFDDAFSAWQIQGLDTNGDGTTSSEEMQELADESLQGLSEYHFYTFAGEGEETMPLTPADRPRLIYEGGRSTLFFGVQPTDPYRVGNGLELAVNDPEYYVAITFAQLADVTLVNAPEDCAARLEPGHPMPDDIAAELYSLPPDVTTLPPRLAAALRGVQGSIIVSCSGAALAATAAEALPSPPKVADNEPIRLRRPTAEPGASETEVGLLGWLAQQQGRLHQAVTEALAGLHRDNNAFWALGSFTFLYGVFSAASGSGDRQAAISSSGHRGRDRQHTRVPASSRSSILQSGLAIGLAVVAALLLQLSLGTAGIPAQWTTIGSYALVAFLGAWLVARKFYGTRRVAGLARVRAVLFEGAPVRSTYARSAASEQRRAEMNEAPGRTPLLTLDGLGPGLGAFVVMTFAVSQNLLPAGLVAVILLAVGASLPAALPGSAGSRSLPDAHPSTSAPVFSLKQAVRWAELLVSSLILCFGLVLLVAGP